MASLHLELRADWWWLVIVVLAIVALNTWYYASHRALLSAWQRGVLVVLRSIGLGCLVLALFMPVARLFSSHNQNPRVAVLVDNSASMGFHDGRGDRAEQLYRVLQQLEDAIPSNATMAIRFARSVEMLPALVRDSFRLNDGATNLELPFTFLGERRLDNIQAVVLVTDGAYNTGNMPVYAAENFGKPVFAIGIGDTAAPRDIAVTSIVTNERGFKGVELPVQVTITADGFDRNVDLILLDGGIEVARQRVQLTSSQRFYRTMLSFTPTTEGVRKLTARIEPVDGEYTTRNNAISEFVTILPNERRIILIAGAPSPDVSLLSEVISADPSIRLRSFIQKFGAEFYSAPPTAADLRAAESIVLVGFPVSSSPDELIALIADEVRRGKPVLFIASSTIDQRKLARLESILPFSIERWGNAEMLVTASLTDRGAQHALVHSDDSRQTAVNVWNNLPPIFRPEAFVVPKPGSEVLATIKVGTTALDEPLLLARASGGSRSVAVLGYGLYRWKLLGEGIERARGKQPSSVLNAFIANALRWLSSDENTKKVRIRTSKRHYVSGEPVEFIADVQDDALRPIEDATVSITVRRSDRQFEVVLQSVGNGRYLGTVAALAGGDYSFTGTVFRGSQRYGSDEGRFTVGEIPLEYQNLRMNAELLRVIAERTGGEFVPVDQFNAATLWQKIVQLPGFRPMVVTATRTVAVWNSWILLALAIAAFGAEWYLRKLFGVV